MTESGAHLFCPLWAEHSHTTTPECNKPGNVMWLCAALGYGSGECVLDSATFFYPLIPVIHLASISGLHPGCRLVSWLEYCLTSCPNLFPACYIKVLEFLVETVRKLFLLLNQVTKHLNSWFGKYQRRRCWGFGDGPRKQDETTSHEKMGISLSPWGSLLWWPLSPPWLQGLSPWIFYTQCKQTWLHIETGWHCQKCTQF